MNKMVLICSPNEFLISSWGINKLNLYEAMQRWVLSVTLQHELKADMEKTVLLPLPEFYYPDFIASKQEDRRPLHQRYVHGADYSAVLTRASVGRANVEAERPACVIWQVRHAEGSLTL